MEEITLDRWDQFEAQLQALEAKRQTWPGQPASSSSEYLFRGHSDTSWLLETTLDRFFSKRVSLLQYYRYALIARPRIEAFTGTHWSIPSREEYKEWLDGHEGMTFHDYKAYDYLAYLRHHGFPSPLLDWTESPYVAAFFAFRHETRGATHVAIYAYQEYPRVGKTTSSDRPIIHRLGPYVSSHKRHFLQQSQYTFCTEIDNSVVYYTRHQNVVALNEPQQDLMWKFLLPVGERRQALTQLNRMNINAFSLFGTEDSLAETIATSDIYVRGRDV
jgi:hypothetical protein